MYIYIFFKTYLLFLQLKNQKKDKMAKKKNLFHLFFLNKNVTKQDYILHGCNKHCMQLR